MNIGPILGDRIPRRDRGVDRLRTFDDVGRLRYVGLRRLFQHVPGVATYLPVGSLKGWPTTVALQA